MSSVAKAARARGRSGAGRELWLQTDTIRIASLPLELGGVLEPAEIGFTLCGDPALPLVVVLGGISAGRNLRASGNALETGWWQEFVGDGLAVDTRKFSVLGVDFLGGCAASTGPGGPGFPSIATADQARAITAVLDHLGIARAHAIVGSSYGGMVGLAFAARFRDRLRRLMVISAAHESHPMATALRTLQRRAVRLGLETGQVAAGLAIARGIAMATYRTAEEFAHRFTVAPARSQDGFRFPVEAYLEHQGASFVRRFSAWSFLCLSESIDLHHVEPALISTPTTVVGVDSDTLVPPWQMKRLADRLGGPVKSLEIRSIYGHDAFLKEVGVISEIVRETLCDGDAP